MKTTITLIPATEALQAFQSMIGQLVYDQLPARYSTDAGHEHEITIEVRRTDNPTTAAGRGQGRPRKKAATPRKGPGRPRKSAE